MFTVRPAQAADTDDAIAALGEAFNDDPLMHYLFAESPLGVRNATMDFFSILFRVRIALQMPAYVLQDQHGPQGVVMGYDISRPVWPEALNHEWHRFETQTPGFSRRLAGYEQICDAFQPAENHYYLGVLGVHPALQGMGAGKALLDRFCALSQADPQSKGVFLETSSPRSLQFYRSHGFGIVGEGELEGVSLWCVFKPT